jgi:hypothetical protein
MASNQRTLADPADGDYEDWFELYNPGTNPVNLAGCYLTDTLSNRFKHLITTNGPHIIPPQGYLLVWADEETGQNTDALGRPRTDLHVNFKLSASGESIGLFAADGAVIDTVEFGPQTNDVSMGRYPDGGPEIVYMAGSASPRAANWLRGANQAPVVAPVGNRTVFVGQAVAFALQAMDPDGPSQTVSFSLEPGAPADAQLTANGFFTWVPAAPGVYLFQVRVTDNGQPPLSALGSFIIEVLARPTLQPLALNGGHWELTWPARPGMTYILDYSARLNPPNWIPWLTNQATGNMLRATNVPLSGEQGYFRLRAAPE